MVFKEKLIIDFMRLILGPFDRGHCPIKIEPQEANEVTKEELTLAKRRLSDDMDISSGSDDSDSDRTIPFVKGRPSTDQHNEAVVSINLKFFLFTNTFLH